MHSVTVRRTDGRQDEANSRSYCVAVRSAKNVIAYCSSDVYYNSMCFPNANSIRVGVALN